MPFCGIIQNQKLEGNLKKRNEEKKPPGKMIEIKPPELPQKFTGSKSQSAAALLAATERSRCPGRSG